MNAQYYFDLVDKAYDAGSSEDIEKAIKNALRLCAEEYGKGSSIYASMLSELGGFYRGQTRYEESRVCFEEALTILKESCGEYSPDYATGINNLAGTYRLMGLYDEAKEAFIKCIDIYKKSVGERHILYASALNNFSLLYLDKGESRRAAELLDESLQILKLQPQLIDEYTTSLVNVAALYYMLKEYQKAEKNLLEAVYNYENKLGTQTPHYHAALNTLGLVCSAMERDKDALKYFEKSMEAARELYGPEHKEYKAAKINRDAALKAVGEEKQ